jgi:hypothetical protein
MNMGRYGGMVKEIEALVRALKASGELDRILDQPEPEPVWRDVTAECEVAKAISSEDDGRLSIRHNINAHGTIATDVLHPTNRDIYKVRKVLLSYDMHGQECAFIVEKLEP